LSPNDKKYITASIHMKVIHLTSNGSPEEKVRLMFRMYDKDGNGSIDAREMNE